MSGLPYRQKAPTLITSVCKSLLYVFWSACKLCPAVLFASGGVLGTVVVHTVGSWDLGQGG